MSKETRTQRTGLYTTQSAATKPASATLMAAKSWHVAGENPNWYCAQYQSVSQVAIQICWRN